MGLGQAGRRPSARRLFRWAAVRAADCAGPSVRFPDRGFCRVRTRVWAVCRPDDGGVARLSGGSRHWLCSTLSSALRPEVLSRPAPISAVSRPDDRGVVRLARGGGSHRRFRRTFVSAFRPWFLSCLTPVSPLARPEERGIIRPVRPGVSPVSRLRSPPLTAPITAALICRQIASATPPASPAT
ncbi:TilS substrate-binding domain-containing protein [Amycolatopsis dendrobii]|uniref:TilS substrate-binding domain-containing protein n=1 Tax=Amycolatopsis dendrobii TaxID=2760662 RepID=UPI0035E40CB8